MMVLRSSPASPFGRKVRIAIALLGLDSEIQIEPADPTNASDTLRRQNPLGKIPALIAEDGIAYYDSRVILEFLDERAGGGKIIPREGRARLAALRLQALSDGILDASILTVYEARWRAHEHHEQKWLEHQAGKVTRALAALEANPPALDPARGSLPNVGQIALACALGYRDFRFGESWRADHPRLVGWLDDFAARVPAFAATKPTG
jgi:glutathione S-transferase